MVAGRIEFGKDQALLGVGIIGISQAITDDGVVIQDHIPKMVGGPAKMRRNIKSILGIGCRQAC